MRWRKVRIFCKNWDKEEGIWRNDGEKHKVVYNDDVSEGNSQKGVMGRNSCLLRDICVSKICLIMAIIDSNK